MAATIVGDRGQITIPKELRERLGIKPKAPVLLEVREEGILIRPTATVPLRTLSRESIRRLAEEDRLESGERERILGAWKRK
ncbi:MAG: AbrB/MazE/SpoVT family DNA-binding domain-containing protein [Rhodocyclales bacterium]|nr:AbrB/MazE/SpoVT family DNA-binding domain-containing protein [Rhodocyclales bacterium]